MHRACRSPLFFTVSAVLILFVPLLSGAQAPNQAPPSSAASASDYVGTDTCKACHEDLAKGFERTPHYATLLNKKATPAHQGCEACHGPGKAHVDAGGDPTKIISFKRLSMDQANARCLECHAYGNEHANFQRSAHASNQVGCISCHDPHHAETRRSLLKKPQPDLCYGCHTEVRAEFARPFRHRVQVGLMVCSDCHNEHGGFLPRQLRATASQDVVCFKCHREKKGPFVFEHVPVKTEGCTSCHLPHGSSNPRLLKVFPVNVLCLQCHTLSLGNAPSQPPIGPAHNQNQKYQACIMCHAFIHGSNFSEVFFKP